MYRSAQTYITSEKKRGVMMRTYTHLYPINPTLPSGCASFSSASTTLVPRAWRSLCLPTAWENTWIVVRSFQVISGHDRFWQVDRSSTGHFRSFQVMTGHFRRFQVMTGHDRSWQVLTGLDRSWQVILGHFRSFKVI